MINKNSADSNVHSMYEKYKEKEMEVWKDRFVYKKMNQSYPSISLTKFGSETETFSHIERKYTVSSFLSILDKIVDIYIQWSKNKFIEIGQCDIFNDDDWLDVSNWCKGVLGEYFYFWVLTDIKCLHIPVNGTNEIEPYYFREVSPVPCSEDNGVDFVCFANDKPSVIQVKTWSDFNKIASRLIYIEAYGQGCSAHYINQDDEHNTFLCWFSSEENGLISINKNESFNGRVVCSGYSTLNDAINIRNKRFWDDFYDCLILLKEE